MIRTSTSFVLKVLLFFCWATGPASAQVIFRDDFDRDALGPAWIAPPYAGWSVSGGKAVNLIDGQGGTLQTAAAYAPASYVIETQAAPFVPNYYRRYAITFGKPDAGLDFGYILEYATYYPQRLQLGRSEGNEFYPVTLDDSLITLDETKPYTFRIEHSNTGLIRVFLNDGSGYGSTPVLQATDLTYKTLGHFGWRVDTETYAEYFGVDWIEARTLPEPAPSLLTDVTVSTGKTYPVGTLFPTRRLYTDRTYTFLSIPTYLNGAAFISTANADKKVTSANYLTFQLTQPAHLYVCYDPRAGRRPAWLDGWQKLDDQVVSTDTGTSVLNIYTRAYRPGSITLGGNLAAPAAGAQTNYLVAAVPAPAEVVLEAEKATLSGPVVAANHPGFSGAGFADYLNPTGDSVTWTVQVPAPGLYQLAFRYALASGGRSLLVKVNGQAVEPALLFSSTGGWHVWRMLGLGTLLKAGANTITLAATGTSGPNIDYLTIKADVVSPAGARLATHGWEEKAAGQPSGVSNYPNPVRRFTTIRYSLPEAGPVQLLLYDAQGRKVNTLVSNQWQPAGPHETQLDAAPLADGIYFYRLQTGTGQQTGRMVVVR